MTDEELPVAPDEEVDDNEDEDDELYNDPRLPDPSTDPTTAIPPDTGDRDAVLKTDEGED